MNLKLNFGPYYQQITSWILNQTSAALYFSILSVLLVGILILLIFISDRFKYSRILFIICSIVTIFIFRSLSLYQDSYNPDEGLHLTNAIALSHDRRLWVATDTTTSGPVSVIVILIVYKIISIFFPSFGITFFLLRMINIIIISVSFLLLHKIFESRLNKKTACTISLFYIMFFSFSWHNDLQAFNSEYTFMLFISIFLYATYKFIYKANMLPLIISGLAFGIMPFIKLQTVPICAVLIIWNIYLILRTEYVSLRKKKVRNHYILLVYMGTVALPSVFLFMYCITYKNGINNAFIYYFLNAIAYTSGNTLFEFSKYIGSSLFTWLLSNAWYDNIFIVTLVSFIAILILFFNKNFKVKLNSNYFFSFMLLLFSIVAVAYPMRLFTHYIIFLAVPAMLFFMETVALLTNVEYKWIKIPKMYIPNTIQKTITKYNVITFFTAMLVLGLHANFPINVLGQPILSHRYIVGYLNPYLTYAAQYVEENTNNDDYVVVWGWERSIFIFANRKSGTAQTDIERLYPPYSSKNIDMYISDIKRNKPKLIIDVVAPYSFTYNDWETYGLEKHAQVWPAISNDYTMIGKLQFPNDVVYRVYSWNK